MSRRFDRTTLQGLLEKTELRVTDFFAAMPGIPEQTVYSRIRALERDGLIYPIGHGLYSTVPKMAYRVDITDHMRNVHHYLIHHFEAMSFCMSESGGNLYISVGRSEILPVVLALSKVFKQVFDRRIIKDKVETLKDAILVDYLVSESPLIEVEEVPVPSIEKTLVDQYLDAKDNVERAFQRAFEVYQINRSSLLRYAARRNVRDEVASLLDRLDTDRIDTVSSIQSYLSMQPVERAWVFGSFARGEEKPDSDIDLLVDYTHSEKLSLLDVSRISTGLEDVVHRKIDLIENGFLLSFAQPSADRDKYLIYERTA